MQGRKRQFEILDWQISIISLVFDALWVQRHEFLHYLKMTNIEIFRNIKHLMKRQHPILIGLLCIFCSNFLDNFVRLVPIQYFVM